MGFQVVFGVIAVGMLVIPAIFLTPLMTIFLRRTQPPKPTAADIMRDLYISKVCVVPYAAHTTKHLLVCLLMLSRHVIPNQPDVPANLSDHLPALTTTPEEWSGTT